MQCLSNAFQGIQGLANLFPNFSFLRSFILFNSQSTSNSKYLWFPESGCHPLQHGSPGAAFLPARILEGDERMINRIHSG